jgi:hypothetical protein
MGSHLLPPKAPSPIGGSYSSNFFNPRGSYKNFANFAQEFDGDEDDREKPAKRLDLMKKS